MFAAEQVKARVVVRSGADADTQVRPERTGRKVADQCGFDCAERLRRRLDVKIFARR